MGERTTFVERLKGQIDEWNLQIDKLEDTARQAGKTDLQGRYLQQLEEMHRGLGEAWKQVRKAQEAGDSGWNDLRPEFEAARDSISAAFDKAMKRAR